MDLRTLDYHTAGEPFRIVLSDVGEIAGANVRERRDTAAATERLERIRRLLCHEPRGMPTCTGASSSRPTTRARTALLLADGEIGIGDAWRNDSIAGTTFRARPVGEVAEGVLTEVSGTAFRTGEHRFVLDPRDPLGTGFVLR